jgi:hypothetical protein
MAMLFVLISSPLGFFQRTPSTVFGDEPFVRTDA